jgi:hypothetical protein
MTVCTAALCTRTGVSPPVVFDLINGGVWAMAAPPASMHNTRMSLANMITPFKMNASEQESGWREKRG